MRNGPTTIQCFAGSNARSRDLAVCCAAGNSTMSFGAPVDFNPPGIVVPAGTGSYTPVSGFSLAAAVAGTAGGVATAVGGAPAGTVSVACLAINALNWA